MSNCKEIFGTILQISNRSYIFTTAKQTEAVMGNCINIIKYDVIRVINDIKPSSITGSDVSPAIACKRLLTRPLQSLFHSHLVTGKHPIKLKEVKLSHAYEVGSRAEIPNSRDISLSSHISQPLYE